MGGGAVVSCVTYVRVIFFVVALLLRADGLCADLHHNVPAECLMLHQVYNFLCHQ